MKESGYQKKIMDSIFAVGGHVVNGQYTKAGEADLQGGIPVNGKLLYITIEVKTEADYHRVMKCVYESNGYYFIRDDVKGLKQHESLQIEKINQVRRKGGLGLIAYEFSQVSAYITQG